MSIFTHQFASLPECLRMVRTGERVLGCVRELDGRARTGSPKWTDQPPRLKKLQSLREAHLLAEHGRVKEGMLEYGDGTAKGTPPRRWKIILNELRAE